MHHSSDHVKFILCRSQVPSNVSQALHVPTVPSSSGSGRLSPLHRAPKIQLVLCNSLRTLQAGRRTIAECRFLAELGTAWLCLKHHLFAKSDGPGLIIHHDDEFLRLKGRFLVKRCEIIFIFGKQGAPGTPPKLFRLNPRIHGMSVSQSIP